MRIFILITLIFSIFKLKGQYTLAGKVINDTQEIRDARVTLFNADTSYFEEIRSSNTGEYSFTNIVTGNYKIGVAKSNYNYVESSITVNSSIQDYNFTLQKETEKGKWDIIVNSPEKLGGTDLGILMPDGKIYYCHDTKDPFYFNPATNDTLSVEGSDSIQGCVGPILLPDSSVWFFGGTLREIYGPGTKKVKKFSPNLSKWKTQKSMLDYRWYPSVSPLSNGKILIVGGGGLNNPIRVNTAETYDPKTSNSFPTNSIAIGNEVSPILPLHNGKTMMTHRPPQLYDPSTNLWSLAGDFVQSNRMSNGDHSDHELILMPDGNVFAFGYKPFNNVATTFVEMYDPNSNSWALKSNISPIRSRAKAVLMPDKNVLIAGGFKEEVSNNTAVNQWGYMKRSDIYHPETDQWRNVSDMNYFREYHAILTLVPDGRIIAVGGEGEPGNEPPLSVIEAYKPPYFFRGIRPEILNLDTYNFKKGGQLSFDVIKTDSITSVLLIANAVNTHFMNSSSNRFIELEFKQSNGKIIADLPSDSLILFDGFYMLFVMVDDIPSIAKIIKVSDEDIVNSIALEDSEHHLNLYPNPTNDVIFINSFIPVIEVKLCDMEGKELLHINSENINSVNLYGFADGIYNFYLKFENGRYGFHKVIKIKK